MTVEIKNLEDYMIAKNQNLVRRTLHLDKEMFLKYFDTVSNKEEIMEKANVKTINPSDTDQLLKLANMLEECNSKYPYQVFWSKLSKEIYIVFLNEEKE